MLVTLGFCGSLTTFSGWELDVFNSWLNADRNSRAGLRDVGRVNDICTSS